jgi:hypothetical protein
MAYGITGAWGGVMRLAFLASSVIATIVATATFACSSAAPATNTEDLTSDAGTKQDENLVEPAPTVVTDAGVVDFDAGVIVGTTDAGALCDALSIRETELNNDPSTPNQIPIQSSTYCGRIEIGDVDFVSFTMPQQIGRFGITVEQATGPVRIEATAGGQPFNFFSFDWPFLPGQPYTLKLTSPRTTGSVDYKIRFDFSTL